MKVKVFALSALALVCCLSVPAKGKKKVSKKKAAIVKVDTVSVDSFSYAMGLAQTGGIKGYLAQRMGIDTTNMADFTKGLQEALYAGEKMKELSAYAAGLQIGQQVTTQILTGINRQITDKSSDRFLNEELFKKAFLEGVNGSATSMGVEQATAIAEKQMRYYQGVISEKKFGENRKKGIEFLALNAKKDSVIKTKSGLQYKVLKKGTGALPTDTSTIKVNYEGKLIDGTIFDSSYARKQPASFRCNQVIKGWTEALKLMPVGSIWEIYIPQELAYGAQQQEKLPPFSTLIFKVELLSIEK
ncbi:MAG: FKBP-type peptidyl-prolyl cis-trans isomerase [Bacteroidaceae bacterium]